MARQQHAPLSDSERRSLRADLDNIRLTAARKKVTLDPYDEANEAHSGNLHFELGCWLYYYRRRISVEGTETRIDCARRIFEAGITNPGYKFFTVFDFGERQFDTLFESGDAEEVIAGLRALIPGDTTGNIQKAFTYFGWPVLG